MASFGFSIGDIIAGLQLALLIYNCGFVQENSADVRYKNFQNDILHFRRLLERLDEALQNAQRRYIDRPRTTGLLAYEPLSKDFEDERISIVGNFLDTLKACESLLEENKKLRVRHSNVLENLHWHLSQQETRVDDLRRRLQLHSEKIRLVLDRLSINLLTDIDGKVDDILELSQQNLHVSSQTLFELKQLRSTLFGDSTDHSNHALFNLQDLHNASDKVARRFQDNISNGAPADFEEDIPLVDGFDALFSHFEQASDGSDQTPEKYLTFLKARWLLARLFASPEYQAARPGFYYKRAVNQIARAIAERISQPGALIAYDEAVLMNLPDASYYVWPPSGLPSSIQNSEPHPLMQRANEINVLSATLSSSMPADADTITVFKSSEEHFRIVRETTWVSRPGERILMSQSVVKGEDRLIPRYALPSLSNSTPDLSIFSRNEEMLYRFETYQDMWDFQAAMTGYGVSHDQSNIRCQVSNDIKLLDKARVQLWQEPITLSTDTCFAITPLSTSPDAQHSNFNEKSSRRDSIVHSIATTNTVHRAEDGWEAESIKVPSIVMFSEVQVRQKRKTFAIMLIELEPGTYVDLSECNCHKNYSSCLLLFVTKRKKKQIQELTARCLMSETGASGLPDANTFDLFPFGTPKPSARKQLTVEVRTEYLAFKFDNLEEKRRFHNELDLRIQVRDTQIQKQQQFARSMQFLGNSRARHRQQHLPVNEGQRVSSLVVPGSQPTAPRLDVLDKLGSLDDSFTSQILRDMSGSITTDPSITPSEYHIPDTQDDASRQKQPLRNVANQNVVRCRDFERGPRDSLSKNKTREDAVPGTIATAALRPIPVNQTNKSNIGKLRSLWQSQSN